MTSVVCLIVPSDRVGLNGKLGGAGPSGPSSVYSFLASFLLLPHCTLCSRMIPVCEALNWPHGFAHTFPSAWNIHSDIFTWPIPTGLSRTQLSTLQESRPRASSLCFYNCLAVITLYCHFLLRWSFPLPNSPLPPTIPA